MNLFTKQKQSHRCRKQAWLSGDKGRGGINWEIGIDIYTLLYIKQITNKYLLCSTGDSTQYSVMAYMVKESKKRVEICICKTDSLCCTPETNTVNQLYFNKNFLKKAKNTQFYCSSQEKKKKVTQALWQCDG